MSMRRRVRSVATDVYRVRGAQGELLYVGIAVLPFKRFKEHRVWSKWWPSAHDGTLETYANRADAELVEARAIRDEKPIWNVTKYSVLASMERDTPTPLLCVSLFWERGEVWIDAA